MNELIWSSTTREKWLTWYLATYSGKYQIDLSIPPEKMNPKFTIQFSHEDVALLHWDCHAGSGFLEFPSGILVYNIYSTLSTGCRLIGFDLNSGSELWQNELQGLGSIDHNKYSNSVILRQTAPDTVTAWGDEISGRYIESVDIRTGISTYHRKFGQGDVRPWRPI